MNKWGCNSLTALRQYVSTHQTPNLISCIVFGSQVRNEEQPDSDLDVMCIVRRLSKMFNVHAISHVLSNVKGGTQLSVPLVRTFNVFKLDANVYGTVHYNVLHEKRAVWIGGTHNIFDMRKLVKHPVKNYLQWSAKRHIQFSIDTFNRGRKWHQDTLSGKAEVDLTIPLLQFYQAVDFALKAVLLYNSIKFPFVHESASLSLQLMPDVHRRQFDFIRDTNMWRWHAVCRKQMHAPEKTSTLTVDDTKSAERITSRALQVAMDIVKK